MIVASVVEDLLANPQVLKEPAAWWACAELVQLEGPTGTPEPARRSPDLACAEKSPRSILFLDEDQVDE